MEGAQANLPRKVWILIDAAIRELLEPLQIIAAINNTGVDQRGRLTGSGHAGIILEAFNERQSFYRELSRPLR
jgi:hypothetical protein